MSTRENKYHVAAEAIGRLLVRDAIWAGDQCHWLIQREVEAAIGRRCVVAPCSISVSDGAAGVGLFLARLFAVNGDRMTAVVLAGTSRCLARSLSEQNGSSRQQEVAAALSEMSDLSGLPLGKELAQQFITPAGDSPRAGVDANPVAQAWRRLVDNAQDKRGVSTSLNQFCTAIFSGQCADLQQWSPAELADEAIEIAESNLQDFACFADPVLAAAFLAAAQSSDNSQWLGAACRIADQILARSEQFGQPWHGDVGLEYPPIGLFDGLSGIGSFLLQLDPLQA